MIYTVKSGDTIKAIAAAHGTTAAAVVAENQDLLSGRGKSPEGLPWIYPGEGLYIPTGQTTDPTDPVYPDGPTDPVYPGGEDDPFDPFIPVTTDKEGSSGLLILAAAGVALFLLMRRK